MTIICVIISAEFGEKLVTLITLSPIRKTRARTAILAFVIYKPGPYAAEATILSNLKFVETGSGSRAENRESQSASPFRIGEYFARKTESNLPYPQNVWISLIL